MQVEGWSTSEVASWRPNGRGDPTDWEGDQQADVRWLAQVERICREAPRSLMDLSRHQYGLARQHLRLLPGEWPGRHRPVAWALPAALMAAMLCPPLLAYADKPISGPEFQVNSYTTGSQLVASVAMDTDADFLVAWQSDGQDGDQDGVFAQRYDNGGNPQGSKFRVNSYTTSVQSDASVAMDTDGDFVVAWHSYDQDASNTYGVYVQRYDSGGNPQGPELPVNTYTADHQVYPSVAMDTDGDFVIAWNGAGPGDLRGIFAQRYDNGGNPQGAEFRVNTYTTSGQGDPSVAMDADGDFVIAWHGYGQGDSDYAVYARRFPNTYPLSGTPSAQFLVNTHTTGTQIYPSVAMDADGDFVIAWYGDGQGDSDYAVYARRYNSGGVPQEPQFLVNSYTTGVQVLPSVGMDADGDFVVAWSGYGEGDSNRGVYAQRYSGNGDPQGPQFLVNTYTTTTQHYPSVAMDADGDFGVAWQSYGQDGDKWGVFARRYGLPHLSLGKEVDDDTPFSGQAINYTLVVTSSGIMTTTGAVISDTLPEGVNFVGPVTVEPSGVGTPGTAPPTLVTDLTVAPGQRVTVTVPATVSTGLAEGTVLTNTAALTSAEISPPLTGVKSVTISLEEVYLPILLRSP